jgi:8-oxo-dGTP diphosphatase
MTKSSKLLIARKKRMLLVRRKKDGAWTFPGGKRKGRSETARRCLKRELREELPGLRLGKTKVWRKVKGKNPDTGTKMHHTIFKSARVRGSLTVGDKREIDRVAWRKPGKTRLTASARFILHQMR